MAIGPYCIQFEVTSGVPEWQVIGPFADITAARTVEATLQQQGVAAKLYDMLDPASVLSPKTITRIDWTEPPVIAAPA